MIIISHRGYWKLSSEKNTALAFKRSFSLGYGTETDIRDYKGSLVISHDIPDESSLSIDSFFEIYNQYDVKGPLALNVKSDGLQKLIKEKLNEYKVSNYFFFDMSIPDTLGYLSEKLNTFVRVSEYETLNDLYEDADGVWIDGFKENIITESLLEKIISDGKRAGIVSADLHKNDPATQWKLLKSFKTNILQSSNIILCTDLPEKSSEFFYG